MHDVRYALRGFRRQPLFTTVAALTLALGIGANTAVFSLVYQVLLRPLPFPHPDRLVSIWNVYLKAGDGRSEVSIPDYLDRRGGARALADAALFTARPATLALGGEPEQVSALVVTPSFFTTLERGPRLGRPFVEDDVRGVAADVAILTDATWRSRFGADPSVVGRTVRIDGRARTVVGVLGPDFDLPPRDAGILLPFAFTPEQRSAGERGNEFSSMIGRLRDGATVDRLDAEMDAITRAVMTSVPARAAYMRNSGFTGRAGLLAASRAAGLRAPLAIVQGAVLLVLLIACVNIGGLLLMRTTTRAREMAIRAAIGAGAGRILRQLFVEGLVLALLACVPGVLVARLSLPALVSLVSVQLPSGVRPALDLPVLLFACAAASFTGIVFGLVPALALGGRGPAATLAQDGTRGSTGSAGGAVRRALVAAEVALAIVLLAGAGLLVSSFARVSRVDAGFSPAHVLTAELTLPELRYPTDVERRVFWQRIVSSTCGIPGATACGLVSSLPFSGTTSAGTFTIVGHAVPAGERPPHAFQDLVLGRYFDAMRIPIVAGRAFDDRDSPTSPRVAVIDALLAQRGFPSGDAVGHQINFGSARNYTIVGVVGTIKATDLSGSVAEGRIYLDAAQVVPDTMGVVVRASGDPSALGPAVRRAVGQIDSEEAIARVRVMDEWLEESLQPRRAPMLLLALFAGIALALAAIGTYGVLAFAVAQRTREFGIRQALGASRGAVLGLVFRDGIRPILGGVAAGLLAALGAGRLLQSQLYGISAHDPAVLAASVGVLFATALLACYIPARRATRVDPAVALRS